MQNYTHLHGACMQNIPDISCSDGGVALRISGDLPSHIDTGHGSGERAPRVIATSSSSLPQQKTRLFLSEMMRTKVYMASEKPFEEYLDLKCNENMQHQRAFISYSEQSNTYLANQTVSVP